MLIKPTIGLRQPKTRPPTASFNRSGQGIFFLPMLDHFFRSELACPTTGEVRLAPGFGEALERLRVELGAS
jgi:hypothetical protein